MAGRENIVLPGGRVGNVNWDTGAATLPGNSGPIHADFGPNPTLDLVQQGSVVLAGARRDYASLDPAAVAAMRMGIPSASGGGSGAASGAAGGVDGGAVASITNLLHQWGLDELIPMVEGWVRQDLSWSEIEVQLRDHTSPAGAIVDRLVPEVRMRNENGFSAMSIAEIIDWRETNTQYARMIGLPEKYWSREYLADLLGNKNLSSVEYKARGDEYAALGLENLANDPQRQAELEGFERYYGVKLLPGEVAGMIFDTDLAVPQVQKRVAAVRLDVAAGRASFGDLSRGEAERLVDVGVSEQDAISGFGVLAGSRELFGALPGFERVEDTIGRGEQLGAVFEGSAAARKRIEDRAKRRRAEFTGGGGFASGRDGFEGLGTAR